MVYILVKHKIRDYAKFKKAFFGNFNLVKDSGMQEGFIFRTLGKKSEVWVLVKWDNLRNFRKFAASKEIPKDNLKRATVVGMPKGWLFEGVEKF